MISGIDVSHHNEWIDWPKVRQAGVRFAIIKASEGTGFTDTLFEQNLKTFVVIVRSMGKQPALATQPLGVESKKASELAKSLAEKSAEARKLIAEIEKLDTELDRLMGF